MAIFIHDNRPNAPIGHLIPLVSFELCMTLEEIAKAMLRVSQKPGGMVSVKQPDNV